ncbi:MAG TPA: hypothetical protein VIH83_00240 [Candidatus Bathyarchaeia archaeon]
MKVLVLDTSAFIMGFNPSASSEVYTVEAVEKELLTGTMAQLRFRLSKEKGNLTVQPPSPRSRETVDEASTRAGEKGVLSEADRDVVALALDLRQSGLDPVIVSDDYAVQNLAEHLQLKYGSLANFGIVHKFQWIMYCPACHRRYRQPARTCRICGTELRRKVLSKTRIGKRLAG